VALCFLKNWLSDSTVLKGMVEFLQGKTCMGITYLWHSAKGSFAL